MSNKSNKNMKNNKTHNNQKNLIRTEKNVRLKDEVIMSIDHIKQNW